MKSSYSPLKPGRNSGNKSACIKSRMLVISVFIGALSLLSFSALVVSADDGIIRDFDSLKTFEASGPWFPPRLEVDGTPIPPLAEEDADVVISLGGEPQIWSLLREYSAYDDVNRFGYYSDLGVGNARTQIFSGENSVGYTKTTTVSSGTTVGLFLHSDFNNDSLFDTGETFLFSERSLTVGSDDNSHQWFMVFDVSAYIGTGALYEFINRNENFSTTGDFDYLIFIEDKYPSGACDHNDMILGISGNHPPEASCPGDTSVFLCEPEEICLVGFICCDLDTNLLSCEVSIGTQKCDTVCFTPTGSGVYIITLIATDSYGLADTCETIVTVTINSPPIATCPGDTTILLCELDELCLPGFSCEDPDGNLFSCEAIGGTLDGESICFVPVEGINTLKLIAVDECGEADTCETSVTIVLNSPPTAGYSGSTDIVVCDLSETCLSGFSCEDPDDNLASCDVIGGVWGGDGIVCFTPVEGINTITLIATDECGEADTNNIDINATINSPPAATCPGDTTLLLCNLDELCLPGFSCNDPDDNLASCQAIGGTLDDNNICFTPTEGVNTLRLIATDECGEADTCETNVTIILNSPPVASYSGSIDLLVCDLSEICLPGFSCNDPDGNLASCDVTGGAWDGSGNVCFTPVEGANTITLIATDECGAADTLTVKFDVILNNPPNVSCPGDISVSVSGLPAEICLSGFYCNDVDGNLFTCIVDGGELNGATICFTAYEAGIHTITLTATDDCGSVDACVTEVSIEGPTVRIEKTHNTLQGHYKDVSITIENSDLEMGGFDFLVAYDASALTAVEVTRGQLLEDCNWEYFTYRFGPFGNCGSGCPTGMLRIVALAETNNGAHHPSCYGTPDSDPYELARMRFLVSNDRTLECQYVPIRFFWYDCGDNSISRSDGDMLYIDRAIYSFENNLIWDEDDDVQFPEDERLPNVGAPDYCLNPDPDKPSALRFISFVNGGIDIICADSIDARGDVNLNGVPNEIADAVVFTNYFIRGLAAFMINVEGQIAATDVNADGIVLSVADLVYLIRCIIGDAQPIPKDAPDLVAEFITADGVISVDAELGAAFIVLEDDVDVDLGRDASHMEILTGFDGTNTRVLIYSFEKGYSFSGDILNTGANIISVEAADYNGNGYVAKLVPVTFSLRSYPNPFNPVTTIEMILPSASDWSITIYNVTGQKLAEFEGYSEAGPVRVNWDASDYASGLYFYKSEACKYSMTRKMVLLK